MKEKCEKIWDIPYELMSGREQNKRVYSTNGLCPTLYCFGGGNTETKIMMKTICLNSKVNGKQPSLNDRVYSRGGVINGYCHHAILHGKRIGRRKHEITD